MKKWSSFILILTVLSLISCKQSSQVVSDGIIQKRKYTKGYFLTNKESSVKTKKSEFRSENNETETIPKIGLEKVVSQLDQNKKIHPVSSKIRPVDSKTSHYEDQEVSDQHNNPNKLHYHKKSRVSNYELKRIPDENRDATKKSELAFGLSLVALILPLVFFLAAAIYIWSFAWFGSALLIIGTGIGFFLGAFALYLAISARGGHTGFIVFAILFSILAMLIWGSYFFAILFAL